MWSLDALSAQHRRLMSSISLRGFENRWFAGRKGPQERAGSSRAKHCKHGLLCGKATLVKMGLMGVEITIQVSEDLQSYEKPEILELEAKD